MSTQMLLKFSVFGLQCAQFLYIIQFTHVILTFMYTVSQKKTSPTFLAVTREIIVGFS